MSDWIDNPEARAWAERALDDLLPKLRESAMTVSIVPDEANVGSIKFAVELGLSIMLDKPIVLAVQPGQRVPEHLTRVADDIVEINGSADLADRLKDAFERITGQPLDGDGD